MGYQRMGVPKELALKLKAEFDIRNFVETGTWQGGTAFWAAAHFPRVLTMEISPEISQKTAAGRRSGLRISYRRTNQASCRDNFENTRRKPRSSSNLVIGRSLAE